MIAANAVKAAQDAFKANEFDAALRHAGEALALDPTADKAYHIHALVAVERREWEKAETALKAAIGISPRNAQYHNSLGNVMVITGRDEAAIETFSHALSIAPNYPPPTLALGQLYLNSFNPSAAADIFQKGLQHAPDHPQMKKGLLYALKDAQQFNLAADLLQSLPPSPDLALAAGEIAWMRRQNPVAEANFVQALSHPPSAVSAFRALVQMRLTTGEDGTHPAAALIKKSVQDNPEAGLFYLIGAELLSEMGDLEGALEIVSLAEKKFGQMPDFDIVAAKAHIEHGQGGKASRLAACALKARPGDPNAVSCLARGALIGGAPKTALDESNSALKAFAHNQFWIAVKAAALRAMGQDYDYAGLYDYDLVKRYDLPPPPEYNDNESFLSQLKEVLNQRHARARPQLGRNHRGGTETESDLRFAAEALLQDFFQAVSGPITDYIQALPEDADHPLYGRVKTAYRLTRAWSVELAPGGVHRNHIHPDGWISAAYVVSAPESNKTTLAFGKPSFAAKNIKGERLNAEVQLAPRAGELILYPSYMWMGSAAIPEGGETLLTLHFKIVPT
jgi:tetratricopeptide (TPR) repeat protein